MKEFLVSPAEAGLRLDQFLTRLLAPTSRRTVSRLIAAGDVTRNARPASKGERVEPGDSIVLRDSTSDDAAWPEPELPLAVVWQSETAVIVDKAAGVPSAALPGRTRGTVAGALLARFPEMAEVGFGAREPGLLHRLDTQTSGLLLAARTQHAFDVLRRALSDGRLEKKYLALVHGHPPPHGCVDAELESIQGGRQVAPTRPTRPGRNVTEFRLLEQRGEIALVEVGIGRGYRHQIRAHLASVGLPLLGDILYGGPDATLAPRHALHASSLAYAGTEVSAFSVRSPLPSDLARVWDGAPRVPAV